MLRAGTASAGTLRGGRGAEGRFPALGCELLNPVLRMGGDAQQDVAQVQEGRDVDQAAALDERIQQRGAPRTLETAREEPVLAPDRDGAQLALGVVVVDDQVPIRRGTAAARSTDDRR